LGIQSTAFEAEGIMPTYEYECTKCNHAFEEFQRITAEPLKRCPKCKGKLRRLMGAGSGIIFKGTGFYETDYKRKSGGGPKGEGGPKSEGSSSSTSSSKKES
jgi:putative FmdB family regulatory protein